MPEEKPAWEQFELIVADIQRQLAPDAEVRHNHWVKGKSGRRRKLDISISQKVSAYPIFIVFDCKRHKKAVKMKDVEAFAGQLEDVRASLGVMISNSGFDAGAKAIATQKNIILQTYRMAEKADWGKIVGENAWAFLIRAEMPEVKASVILSGDRRPYGVSFHIIIFNEKGEIFDNLKDLFWKMWQAPGSPRFIGDIRIQIKGDKQPLFIQVENKLIKIEEFIVIGRLIAKRYAVNLRLAEGSILEDVGTGEPVYQQLASEGFDWAEIMRTQPGIEISPEEYKQSIRESRIIADINNANRFLRIVLGDKKSNRTL
jgi:Restriction endonuclease